MKHYVFHDGQLTEHPDYPGLPQMPHGAYMYAGHIMGFGLVDHAKGTWSMVDRENVPKEFLLQLLLLGVR